MATKTQKKTSKTSKTSKTHVSTDPVSSGAIKSLLDLDANVDVLYETLIESFGYDFDTQRPGQAFLHDGVLQPTELDLSCLMSALAKRKAIIVLPKYMAGGAIQTSQSQSLLSRDNRHGQFTGMVSNKEYFSFSMKVIDQNVLNTTNGGSLGAPRNFFVIGRDGRWHPGWDTIQFVPNAQENDFLTKFDFAKQGDVAFKHFVHPKRRESFYSPYYLAAKIAIARLEDEASSLRKYVKENKALKSQEVEKAHYEHDDSEKNFRRENVKVPVFQAEVDVPFTGELGDADSWGEVGAEERLKKIDYTYLPQLRFATRATELAFYKARQEEAALPAWVRGVRWNWMQIKRTKFRAIDLNLGTEKVVLRYRTRAKVAEVAR